MIEVIEITTPAELKIAFDIRKKVFVQEQKVPLEEEYDEFEEICVHFLAFFEETPVGTARMRDTKKGIKLERFCVLEKYRGFGVGTSLVKKLLTKCKNKMDSQVYLYAQVNAEKFYSKFNFKAIGEIFIDAGIKHIEMRYIPNNKSIFPARLLFE